jgi:formylglycine-generating enzyme required for sulfatase activity
MHPLIFHCHTPGKSSLNTALLGLWVALLLAPFSATGWALQVCPACAKEFDSGAKFCPFDGQPLETRPDKPTGTLVLTVTPPEAVVTIAGLPRGSGGSFSLELPAGSHRIEADGPFVAPQRMSVVIRSGQIHQLHLDLQPKLSSENGRLANVPPQGSSQKDLARTRQRDMMEIPAGNYPLGSERGNHDERPVRIVKLPTYWIDRTEVTNLQYLHFLQAVQKNGHEWCHPHEPPNKDHTPFHTYAWALRFSWIGGRPPQNMEDHPVVLVDWWDAYAFAKWSGKRLPTEDEWEAAARGTDGREYPWGNTFYTDACNVGDYPIKVGTYPNGVSPWEVLDMAGNVGEWTATVYEPNPRDSRRFKGRFGLPIVKGGSWDDESRGCRSAARDVRRTPHYRSTTTGFRCVSDVHPDLASATPIP